jgi:orotidine-5'-phosphate decarboxylase
MQSEPFGARLHEALMRTGPLCAGIDPSPALLARWDLDDSPAGLEKFALRTVEAVAGVVGTAKPQAAFFERHGSRGVAVLERTIAELRASGTLVLLDGKRGDIGSTSEAYADAYLDPRSPLAADALTVSPFLGFGTLRPMVDTALRHGNGLFVLARTSNPEGAEIQLARTDLGTVADRILRQVAEVNAGAAPLGSVGVVVGATVSGLDFPPDRLYGPYLVPGVGAQGATFADVRKLLGPDRGNLVVPVSRGLLGAGPDTARLRERAEKLAEECLAALRG